MRPQFPVASITIGLDKTFKGYFDRCRLKGEMPNFLKDKIKGKLVPTPFFKNALKYNDYKNQVNFYGYLDECLLIEDKYYAALDHKTRSSFPLDIHPAYQLQMDCYTFLLEANKFLTQNKAFLVYYVPTTITSFEKGITFDCKIVEVKTDPERARTLFYQALEIVKGEIPEPNPACEFCKYVVKRRD